MRKGQGITHLCSSTGTSLRGGQTSKKGGGENRLENDHIGESRASHTQTKKRRKGERATMGKRFDLRRLRVSEGGAPERLPSTIETPFGPGTLGDKVERWTVMNLIDS